jgi:hypothetical protein
MTNSAQDHGKQKPETVEDLAPREDETAELMGGVSQENAHGSGGGGGAGKASGLGGSGAGRT